MRESSDRELRDIFKSEAIAESVLDKAQSLDVFVVEDRAGTTGWLPWRQLRVPQWDTGNSSQFGECERT